MLRRLLNWLLGPVRKDADRTLEPHLYQALVGAEDRLLEELKPLDQAWLERHQN